MGLIGITLAASAAVCAGVAEPVVDMHLHSYERDPRFALRLPNPGTGAPMTVKDGREQASATVAALRTAGVVRGIVGGQSSATDDRMIALDPDRLRAGYTIDAVPTAAQLQDIRARHAAGKLVMIGEVAYQYAGIRHDDPGLEPLWALAEELDVPIAVHAGAGPPGIVYQGSPKHRARFGDPLALEEVLVRHPKMKLIIMHGGWPFLTSTIALLHAYPQVHVDLGAIDWAEPAPGFDDYLRGLVTYGSAKRVLFGSDQMVWPDAIATAIARFRDAPYLTRQQKRDVLFNNAVRLFGWSDLAACTAATPATRK